MTNELDELVRRRAAERANIVISRKSFMDGNSRSITWLQSSMVADRKVKTSPSAAPNAIGIKAQMLQESILRSLKWFHYFIRGGIVGTSIFAGRAHK